MGPKLTPRHLHHHERWDQVRLVTLHPAPNGLWHVALNSDEPHATTEPVTEAEVYRLLAEWGIEVDEWSTRPAPVRATNPAWETGVGRTLLGRPLGGQR
jgi:hypothetical protein